MALFEDSSFPALAQSLFLKVGHRPTTYQVANWKRPKDINTASQNVLFNQGSSADDVVQGFLGDCYFLGALSVVATRDDLIKRLIVRSDFEKGAHTVRFFKDGKWVEVTVDDRIPCLPIVGTPAYARSKSPNEWWVSIIEKAYAKLHGCYEMIEDGSISEALCDLTGGVGERVVLNDDAGRKLCTQGLLWQTMLSHYSLGFLMGCAVDTPAGASAGATTGPSGTGIVYGHAYGILEVRGASGGRRMIKLRNPWGRGEWRGNYADDSPMWTDALRRELGQGSAADDGVFWMEYDDFCRVFTKLYVCRLYDDGVGARYDAHLIEGEWRGLDAGGSLTFPTWRSNPQWVVTNSGPRPVELFACLSQADARLRGTKEYANAIGLYVLKTLRADAKKFNVRDADRLAETPFGYARAASVGVTVEAGSSVVLMPACLQPEMEGSFTLQVFASERVAVRRLPEPAKQVVGGEWKGPSAGGCPSYPTWVRNPQYYLMPVRPKAEFTIVLRQFGVRRADRGGAPEKAQAIGLQVCKATENNRITLLMGDSVVGQSEYVEAEAVSAVVHVKDPHKYPYLVIPSTYAPAKHGRFELTVYSDTNFVLQPAPEGSLFSALEDVLAARASGQADVDLDDSQHQQQQQQQQMDATQDRDLPARFIRKKDNPLYTTSSQVYGSRPQQPHERATKMFAVSQQFSRSHVSNYRGTGWNQ